MGCIPTVQENKMAEEVTKVLLDNWLQCTTTSNRYTKVKNIVLSKILECGRRLPEDRIKGDEEEW
jgi:hypothetical protein